MMHLMRTSRAFLLVVCVSCFVCVTRSFAVECESHDVSNVWNSGDDLSIVWSATAGDFDQDGAIDILTHSWQILEVYENTTDNMFVPVFSGPSLEAPVGAYRSVTFGDTDNDGLIELIGAEVSTLNEVVMYENVGDNMYELRFLDIGEPDFTGSMLPHRIVVADADADGHQEIIFDTSSSDGSGSILFIYEHVGRVGENVYAKVFEWDTVSSLFDFTVGDADNDGAMDIVLGFGGIGGFPVTLRRLENIGDDMYIEKSVSPGGIGLALSPLVYDVDMDGENELIFAGVIGDQGGGLFIYEAFANDLFQLTYSQGGLSGNGLSIGAGDIGCGSYPVIAIGSFDSALQLWSYDGASYAPIFEVPETRGGQLRDLEFGALDADDAHDLLAASSVDNRVHMYEFNIDGSPASADFDGDGAVAPADLAQLLGHWGLCEAPDRCPEDLSGDGVVGPEDLAILLGAWG